MRIKRKPIFVVLGTMLVGCTVLMFTYTPENNQEMPFCADVDELPFENEATIPKHIHQMFFYKTDKQIPKRLEDARLTWRNMQTGFQYTLWNETMVLDLIASKYPKLLALYGSYQHWVRQADVARYIVLYEHGGVYIDLDIKSIGSSLLDLYTTEKNTSGVILYLTHPRTVSNDFMVAKKRHPFLKHVLCGLRQANRWYILPYVTTMMSTGPLFLNSRYNSYSPKTDIEVIESSALSKYVKHIEGASWHQIDGKVIWWVFVHRRKIMKYFISVITFVTFLVIVLLLKRRCHLRKKIKISSQ